MNTTVKGSLFILTFLIVLIAVFILSEKRNYPNDSEKQKSIIKAIGNIQFKGKVIKSTIIKRYGKRYYMICIKLDYTNTNDFYIFRDLCGLKIKDGIATMSGGIYFEANIVDYVEINMNNSGKEKFYYKNGETEEFELSFGSGGIIESDMNACN